ncbi:hypothetical protein [Paractinoplanes atraurantiacus]|uniref:Uncharacterized protein n=1 Tax=Paractinoplanes atraurantiacus TaxID=1036182 RepID=A0A285J478_9ACTN|nr:hypothetical protein [Actinoplanes atraurantiacus]SNY55084.1 hypothetical protein SAMN05421748_11631 [Actinoplanes atraurantiacus]
MSRLSRPALLTAAVSLTAGLVVAPGAAYAADTATQLSAAQMAAALKSVATTSTAAAAPGWRATTGLSGQLSGSGLFVADPAGGVGFERFISGGLMAAEYAVAGKGRYEYLGDPTARSAVKMMGRPAVKFVFTADKALNFDAYVKDAATSPATVLTDDTDHAGTKTVHDDAPADYRFKADSTTVTIHVNPAGVLTSARATDDGVAVTLAYAYGPQHVTVPAATATIGAAALDQGITYLDMPTIVKQVARQGAADARKAAHGHKVKVASLRKVVRRDVAAANKSLRLTMVKTKNTTNGVRVYATNPWTHKTTAYTLKASGTKVVTTKNS